MSKSIHTSGQSLPEEDYELQPASTASDPLLPSYDSHTHTHSTFHSPHKQLEQYRRHSKLRRAFSCLCLALLVAIPSLALAACYFGRTTLDRVRGWEQLPPDVKDWLDKVVPVHAKPDYGAFPTDVGYAGPTPTGSEAALLATAPALPLFSGVSPLVPPTTKVSGSFNIMQHWGNLSPFYSVASHGLPESSSIIPERCELDQLHWLQRHGARYPTLYPAGPGAFASRLKDARGWKASGDLAFLNEWTYKLGGEVLTPFGRSQLFNLGVAARLKYGFLLDRMKGRLPVFRTESQDRMLRSAQNFATGFFGFPAEEQYNLEVIIEADGFNNTLAPYKTCRAAPSGYGSKLKEWDGVFLKDARERLGALINGYDLSLEDVKDMMEMCAYETVALGYSSFCNLFTQKEWKGFEYRNDIYWWYDASFGYAPAKAMGIGWVQELVSRLTKARLTDFNSTTNSSLHNDVHFPLNDPIYVDFTHDTQFGLLLPTMNLTSFAETGEPPLDHIPAHRSFIASKIMPFATNLQLQSLSCSGEKKIRIILNDAPVPLTGITGCERDEDGLCTFDTFVDGMKTLIGQVDYQSTCKPFVKDQENEVALEEGANESAELGEEVADSSTNDD